MCVCGSVCVYVCIYLQTLRELRHKEVCVNVCVCVCVGLISNIPYFILVLHIFVCAVMNGSVIFTLR